MIDEEGAKRSLPESAKGKISENRGADVPAVFPPNGDANAPAAPDPITSKELTEEEQMALYEKDLKENDWGHQPC